MESWSADLVYWDFRMDALLLTPLLSRSPSLALTIIRFDSLYVSLTLSLSVLLAVIMHSC